MLKAESGLTTGCSRRCSAALRNAAEPDRWAAMAYNAIVVYNYMEQITSEDESCQEKVLLQKVAMN